MTPVPDFLDKSKHVLLDLECIAFIGEIDLLQAYLHEMEGFLETQIQQHEKDLKQIREQIKKGELVPPPDQPPPEAEYNRYQLEMLDHFANMLRKSFFVSLYGFLESRVATECREQKQRRDDILLSLSDLGGQRGSIIKSKTYLTKVLKFGFSFSTEEWREIQGYRRLRNCIVHNEGRLDEGMKPGEADKLREYVDRKQTLSIRYGEVSLHKGFCGEAVDVVERFLTSLLFPDSTNV